MRTPIFPVLALILAGCGAGSITGNQQQQVSDAGGAATPTPALVAWPVANGNVTAYELNASLTRGQVVGTTQTDGAGNFTLALMTATRAPLLVVVSSGTFIEPATGTSIALTGSELTAMLPAATRLPGDTLTGTLVSPVSHLIATLAAYYASQGSAPDAALLSATTVLDAHFGGITWSGLGALPDLTTAASGVVQLNDAARGELVIAGLSQEAKNLSVAKNLTPGGPLNSLSLLEALASDLAGDGYFDGAGAGGARLAVANAYSLDGQTVRATLAQGVSTFLSSTRNASAIAQADSQALLTAIATDSSPQIFRDQGGGSIDITPPSITFTAPAANTSVHGQVTIDATATDTGGMHTFAFTAPAALVSTVASTEVNNTLHLHTVLDVGALPDGPLTISVAATDASSNTASANLTLSVANHGPLISVSAPSASAVLKGIVSIQATAEGQNSAQVTSLVLVNPPAGAAADTLPAAEQLAVSWDTTKVLEGPITLHFEATDNFGGITELLVPFTVDNVPFGTVNVTVSAGAPISGASVSIFALDNTTGAVNANAGTNGLLGSCSSTDVNGFVSCTLSAENYEGPITVRASGTGLHYVDPSDGFTVISIPQTFVFTTTIGDYKTGAVISVPLSLYTTLADREAAAYAQGVHRTAAVPHLLTDALLATDPLFPAHLSSTTWDLRSVVPVSLTTSPQSLRDVVLAALPDVALNQLARDESGAASVSAGGVITAITLTQLLSADVGADGQFDGLGNNAAQISTPGNPAQPLDASWLRFAMARSLDEWFSGPTNKSGLLSSDVQNAGVFDHVATDVSILFPAGVVPPPYDNSPPVATLLATFTNGSLSASAPISFNGQLLVAGALSLTASTTDTSGVASTTVQIISASTTTTVTPGVGSNTSRVVATIDTTKFTDGPLQVRVSACDKLNNCGTTLFAFALENTAPAITLQQPVPPAGYPSPVPAYSSVVPASITVTDAQQVASVVETNLSVVLSDATSTGAWTGSWSIPTRFLADGPQSFAFVACGLTGACRTLPVPFIVDRTPPTIAVTTSLPAFTNAPSGLVSLSATSDDARGSGVAGVFARNLSIGSQEIAGTLSGGIWTVSGIPLQSNRTNTIAVYAKDFALDGASTLAGANSGSGQGAPFQVQLSSLLDRSNPSIALSATQPGSYFDERGVVLIPQAAQGLSATTAWKYDPSPASNNAGVRLLQVDTGATQTPIHKTVQRVAMGTTTAALTDLLNPSGSATNTPYLSFTVPFQTNGTESPIVGATYSATVACSGCAAFAPASGALIPDTTDPSGTRFLLPIASDFIPALGQVPSTAAVQVTAFASDAAGNTTAAPPVTASFAFALDAPPILGIVEDPNSADPDAAANFRISNNTYANSFAAPTAATPAEGERIVKYVIYNLGSTVGFAPQLAADPSDPTHPTPVVEDWEAWEDQPLSASFPDPDPFCTPCGQTTLCPGEPYVHVTFLAGGGICSSVAATPNQTFAPTKQTTAPLVLQVYRLNGDGSLTTAQLAANGAFVVPSPTAGSMGMLAVFVGRTSNTVTRLGLGQAGPASLVWVPAIAKYETGYADISQGPARNNPGAECPAGKPSVCYPFLQEWDKRLDSAQSNVFASLPYTANSFALNTLTPVGGARSATLPITRVIAH
jgi:hypothetical protein